VLALKTVTLVAAMAKNRAIGFEGAMPWHLPRELRHFKETTMGRPIVMGRKTWESIGRVLPGRQNIVLTRNVAYRADGCDVVHSLENAAQIARGEEIMIIGGGRIYAAALPFADRMILTRVDCEPEADTWFPEWDEEEWTETGSRCESADDANPCSYRVIELQRRAGTTD
jgi:dihydrofolate reductase